MELDKALQFAVILAWEDLVNVSTPCSARVEYLRKPGTPLDYLSVWSVRAGGEQYLVCDYWTWTSSAHPNGVRFRNGYCSARLAQSLDLIMKNQDQFTHGADAGRNGLVLIYSPTEDDRAEAAAWVRDVQGKPVNLGAAADERARSLPLLIVAADENTEESLSHVFRP